ncbi:MAG: hypothetical protein G01um101470_792 [Parcubacteria group bacterium Gr01-1014_70]|nr:MAG: hypothetical protein G01um101470_792 [Parcubacteria group bacterium Gr01-1014_70]
MWYVYFLREQIGKLYIGSTGNLQRRLNEHVAKKGTIQLLGYVAVQTEEIARKLEKYLKTGSGRAVLKKRILTDEA